MAVGIRAFSSYVPWYRLSRQTIADAWAATPGAGRKAAGARAVAGFDEDALTMAADAAMPLAERHRAAGGAFGAALFASTSAPYAEKSSASLLAGACDLAFERIRTTDLTGSSRAGVQALLAAVERLQADPMAADALVAGADVRTPEPESDNEGEIGDAAAAFVVGRKDSIADVIATHSVAAEMLDAWRTADDPFVRSADSKFAQSAGFIPSMKAAIAGALASAGVESRDVTRFVLGAPGTPAAAALLKAVGIDAAKLVPLFEGEIGHTGVAQPLLSLAAALEASKPGETIVLAAWGDGADAIVFRVTDAIARYEPPRKVKPQIDAGRDLGGYGRYLKARRLAGSGFDEGPESTNVLFTKEQAQNLRLHGAKCRHCGTVQFPAQQTCVSCRQTGTDRIRLSRDGKVFTFTRDNLNVAAEPTTVMSVVDLAGGGRMYLPLTDVDPATVEIGASVELTFRYYHSGSGFRQYFWKARPVR